MRILVFLAFLALLSAEVYFEETFPAGWESRWVVSKAKDAEGTSGKWGYEAGKFYGNAEAQKGIKTTQDARFYAISADMGKSFSNKDKNLIVSFTVKHEQNIDCGGGYLKILKDGLKQESFKGEDAYNIMFGPDICGTSTRKVHAILNYNNENKLIKKNVPCKTDTLTHLYTLHLFPNNTYEIYVDMEKIESGKLEDDWDLLAPREIPDPSAKKPSDWVDEAEIDDPQDKKPADWDKPQYIEDEEAEKPEEWNDEEDGEWHKPTKPNPEYKGEWHPKRIANPAFKGPWKAPMIANPAYKPDPNLYLQENMRYIGIEIWQVRSGTIFDNFLVTDDLDYAKEFATKNWRAYKDGEKAMFDKEEEERRKKDEEERKKMEAETKSREQQKADELKKGEEEEDEELAGDLEEEEKEEAKDVPTEHEL